MSLTDPRLWQAAAACADATSDRQLIGLEVEVIPVLASHAGSPNGRVTLDETVEALDLVAAESTRIGSRTTTTAGLPMFTLADGGSITFEPGGQIEVAPTPAASVDEAMASANAVLGELAAAFSSRDIALMSAGIDPWHERHDVTQQLPASRYQIMDSYLDACGPSGRLMMRHTAALQINLDLGTSSATDRWRVANLVSPIVTATFACSPALALSDGRGPLITGRATRADIWASLDPTRTGIPDGVVDGDDIPTTMAAAALEAPVIYAVRNGVGVAPPAGLTLGAWLGGDWPDVGEPTVTDIQRHFTTLFHEVRPRGFLEFRGVDALPARWRSVPATLLSGLLYDEEALRRVGEMLLPRADSLDGLFRVARADQVADGSMCALAVEVWSLALDGARRRPGMVSPELINRAETFIDRFTLRGHTPADELADLLDRPSAALDWCREPIPTSIGVA